MLERVDKLNKFSQGFPLHGDLGNDLFFAIFLVECNNRLLEEKCLVFWNERIKDISLMISKILKVEF